MQSEKRIPTYKLFYQHYLSEHQNKTSRYLHFIGTALVFICLGYALVSEKYLLLYALPVLGYGFAWVGHFFFEKNKPATFKYPFWSLLSDIRLFFELLLGKQRF